MSRQWVYNTNRHLMKFINGMHEFIDAAKKYKHDRSFRCPSRIYKNEKDCSSTRTINSHLFQNGFMPNYNA